MRKSKEISVEDAVKMVHDGMTIISGGFGGAGEARVIIHALAETDVKDLTVITNSPSNDDKGFGRLITKHKIKKLICTHIGTCPEAGRQMIAGDLEVELIPQGSFAEKIRCGGVGLGGFYTETGVGTLVEENKETKVINGVKYIFEEPLRGEIAFVSASYADEAGNLYYGGSTKNFNPAVAMAADVVIAQVKKIVKVGELAPEDVGTPGILVDYLVVGVNEA